MPAARGAVWPPTVPEYFLDRREAGRRLARRLVDLADRTDVRVLGIPRGGVPVAFEVARALHAPLDVIVVRKLGYPGAEELAMGAIASGGVRVLNQDVLEEMPVPEPVIRKISLREADEVNRREARFRGNREPCDLRDKTVVVVDDGLATGSTMRAAVISVKRRHAAAVVVAVPVAASRTCRELEPLVDRLECVIETAALDGVGAWYLDFNQTSDDEVRQLLDQDRELHEDLSA